MAKRNGSDRPGTPVSIDVDGKQHHGTYYIDNDIITVSSQGGSKSTQVGLTPTEVLAKMLLRELVTQYGR